jgi:hypothetical protein
MRRLLQGLALVAVAHAAAAQLPPSIKKPIEAARKSVNATNAQSGAVTQAASPAPAPAQSGAPSQARAVPPAAGKVVEAPAKGRVAAPMAEARDSSKITFEREVFAYVSDGRRDPFASPIETGEIRPLLQDLSVVAILYDARGNNSVAVMRDQSTQQQYSAKVGQVLGRAKVSQIRPQEVVMTINEYGFSRQEILKLNVPGMNQQFRGKP